MIRGVLLDLAGVLYDGGAAIPGSAMAVARLKEAGLPARFVTNSTRAPRRHLLAKLAGMGFGIGADELFTPARAACDLLRATGRQAHLLIHPDLAEDFDGLPPAGPEISVIVGDAAQHFTYQAMNAAYRQLATGADLLALAANRSFRDTDGQLSIDAGAFVRALEYAARKDALVLGKPAPAFFDSAMASMGCAPEQAAMVGDDAEADIAGALQAGIGQAVLVRSGKFIPGDETRATPRPSHVADDLAAAVDWILEQA